MAFMKRFNEEKMPTALSNKDGPCPDFSSTSPYIICIDKKKYFNLNCFNSPLTQDLIIQIIILIILVQCHTV